MALFEFELKPVEEIQPWGEEPTLTLSWFALTDGVFRMNVGDSTLFRYSKEILRYWETSDFLDADYQIASFARDMLNTVAAAKVELPDFLQPLASNWERLCDVENHAREHEAYYEAFRWLGHRTPWTSYLVQHPVISFVRQGDNILIGWDNRDRVIEGIPVWESTFGSFVMPLDRFLQECRQFSNKLLADMHTRIKRIEIGEAKAQIPLNSDELLTQHKAWQKEFDEYFATQGATEDSWLETQKALALIFSDSRLAAHCTKHHLL